MYTIVIIYVVLYLYTLQADFKYMVECEQEIIIEIPLLNAGPAVYCEMSCINFTNLVNNV